MARCEVVGIGCSLGGLVAVEALLGMLPRWFALPLVIVQHRRADADTRLTQLLQHHTVMTVREPDDKEPLRSGHVYVAPPNYHMMVDARRLHLSIDPPVWYARPSIDVLFESVADAFGARGAVVMLTGANDDGAAGARAVKAAGGVVLVQDPVTAESAVAPRAVLAATNVDAVLDLAGLAARIASLDVPTSAFGRV